MNKVICDICGTSYPDTATNCPICGFERDQMLSVLDEDIFLAEESVEEAPAAVKGGRFSHSNVRKRNNGAAPAPDPEDEDFSSLQENDYYTESSNQFFNADSTGNIGI
jgi:hypothetical protein